MLGVGRITAVLEAGRQATGQAEHPIRGPQQQRTGVAGDGATIERGNNRAAFSRCKRKPVRVTLCRHRGLPLLHDKALSQKNFRSFRAPMHLTLVRDPGLGYTPLSTHEYLIPATVTPSLCLVCFPAYFREDRSCAVQCWDW